MRVLYFAEQNSTLGPLIKLFAMKDDFANYLKLTLLFMIGFSFAIRALLVIIVRIFNCTKYHFVYV